LLSHVRRNGSGQNLERERPTDGHEVTIFEDLCRRAAATGNLVQDAWLAALAVESGCEWITTDGDFARFAGLRWRRPF